MADGQRSRGVSGQQVSAALVGGALLLAAHLAQAAPQPPVSPVILNESVDDSSLTVAWQKPSSYTSITSYRVYVNNVLKCTTSNGPTSKPRLYCHIGGLAAGTYYDGGTATPQGGAVQVAAVDGTGESSRVTALASSKTSGSRCACTTSPCVPTGSCKTMSLQNVVFVHTFAAQNTEDTTHIQQAIDNCASNGKVVIAAGETFISGALFFQHGATNKSNCTLQVDGTLSATTTASKYPFTNNRFPLYGTGGGFGTVHYPANHMGLINTCDSQTCAVSNLRLTGSGSVNGGPYVSGNLTTLGTNMAAAHGDSSRADLVNLNSVTGLYVSGLHFQDPPMHVIFVSRSTNVSAEAITSNSYRGCSSCIHNGAGIDLATSTGGYIFGSSFDDGDDCINLNAGSNQPGVTENRPDQAIRIFDNTTLHGHGGVVFGSFTAAWIKNIVAEDNYFNGTEIGYRFKTGTNRGGGAGGTTSMADGVILRDTVFNNILSTGIEMTGAYPDSTGFPSGGIGFFRWITISNITGSVGSNAYAINISGNPSPHHTNLSLSNVHLTGGSSSKGISVYQVSNSTFNSVTASTGNFFIEPGSWGNTFTSCVPTPTPR